MFFDDVSISRMKPVLRNFITQRLSAADDRVIVGRYRLPVDHVEKGFDIVGPEIFMLEIVRLWL